MQKAGYSKNSQVQTFLKHKQYQQALNVDPSQLNKVVNTAYAKKIAVKWPIGSYPLRRQVSKRPIETRKSDC